MEGSLIIKRKAFWVKRYARIDNFTFIYKKDKSEKTARYTVDLRKASVKYSQRVTTGENFIQVTYLGETLLIAFESLMEFDTWSLAFKRQSQMIQEENAALRESQVAGDIPSHILDNSVLNESTILATGNISQLKNVVNDEDSKSLAQVGAIARRKVTSNTHQTTVL
jgi:hypothetical protein